MRRRASSVLLLCLVSGLSLACDGQQYVSPSTVALVVTDDATQMQRVNRCHYVPVLLGSRVQFRYEINDDLRARLTITRDDLTVTFEPDGAGDTLHIDTDELDGSADDRTVALPDGYTATLQPGCTPDDEYEP